MSGLVAVLAFLTILAAATAGLVAAGLRGIQVVVRWRGESSAERKAAKEATP